MSFTELDEVSDTTASAARTGVVQILLVVCWDVFIAVWIVAALVDRRTAPSVAVSLPAPASPGHRFWPVGGAAQADYETLRAHVLATGAASNSLIATRFAPPQPARADHLAERRTGLRRRPYVASLGTLSFLAGILLLSPASKSRRYTPRT